MKYIVFDVDGTLNQTTRYAVIAYQTALEKRNYFVDETELISCIGMSPEAIIERLFGGLEEQAAKEWFEDIKKLEYQLMKEHAAPFDGVEEMLAQLKLKGYKLAICSNAYYDHIEHVLQAIHLKSYFDEIASLEKGTTKSEILQSLLSGVGCKQACMVGDRRFDLAAARDNGIPFVGCAYGYAPDEIQTADAVVKSPGEILEAVDTCLKSTAGR